MNCCIIGDTGHFIESFTRSEFHKVAQTIGSTHKRGATPSLGLNALLLLPNPPLDWQESLRSS